MTGRPPARAPTGDQFSGGLTGERGAVTVEAAIGLCTLVTLFLLITVSITALLDQLRCQDAAAEAARLIARGDRAHAEAAARRLAPAGATLTVTITGDQVGTEVTARLPGGLLPGHWLHAHAAAVLEPGEGTVR